MSEKAMENIYESREFKLVLLGLLLSATFFVLGFWLGGWRESLLLRSELSQIPDINQCY